VEGQGFHQAIAAIPSVFQCGSTPLYSLHPAFKLFVLPTNQRNRFRASLDFAAVCGVLAGIFLPFGFFAFP
jgi:hypothetical protein